MRELAREIALAIAIGSVVWLVLATHQSIEKALSSVPGICRVNRASKDDPDIRELYYIRGIIRKRIYEMSNYCDEPMVLDDLKAARSWGVPLEELRRIAIGARNFTQFRNMITDVIDEYKGST